MKNLHATILTLLIFGASLAQKNENDLLKNYGSYVEKNIEMGKWSTKFYLTNGLVSVRESYWKNELRSRTEYKYDRFGNVEREINTYDINEGQINDISNLKLEYDDSLLVRKTFDFGTTEKYSDFTELGKPKLIEKKDEVLLKALSKEQIEYDDKGNIIKSTEFTDYRDSPVSPKPENEKCIITYKYDDRNNVIEINRKYEPKQEFPIAITGGPFLYEYEYFRYKYNKNGLWTKKFKTVDGKEYLIAKRKYK
ncbi:hypothetical protein [Flagellimonas meishanensis]|uniref:hypothetical protein n=1 Tax=Flagellimonas meishanensis TaxID=2873264 RepID=UPI001CA63EAD|nr:hypothetical protein [[Muricauda] meishanensis]